MWRISLNGLTLYVLTAMLARIATGGGAVAVILLAHRYGLEGKMAGALVACLTAPHIFGPVYGRWLDQSHNPLKIIALACFSFTAFYQLAILGFAWNSSWLSVSALLMCGASSSFMMGGLSTQLAYLVNDDLTSRRKAQSWDTITYGFGLTLGPMMIAMLTGSYSVSFSIALLMSLPVLSGCIMLFIPTPSRHPTQQKNLSMGFAQVISVIRRSSGLRRTLAMTSGASFSVAALPVLAVYLSESWQHSKESGAYLVTLYGIGCLCGAVALMLRPLRANAIILLRNVGSVLLVTLLLVVASQSFNSGLVTYWLCGVVNSIFFAVTLAARSEYAPQQGAAQVYMWVAAAKISVASMGAFVAGTLVDLSTSLPLLVAAGVLAATLVLCFYKGNESRITDSQCDIKSYGER
ncbi:MFS transporter [Lacimicrobium sp. SS2-24]|uniref:MFS transporter n=1 Tax=Lacimicrobium sp. SS2-24 TaxID=2005569 RepID=UPI000B4C162C|nr:MFS transporter [Lacimicrobium sp. SS2-24]